MTQLKSFVIKSSLINFMLYELLLVSLGVAISNGPFFEDNVNITTQLSNTAYLPCNVRQLGNKSVSWVRVRDDHILTVDRMTFIADERFQSFFVETTGIWTLQIKYVQARDAGLYECQVSSEPKVSARVHLNVVVPRTELVGDSVRYVQAGSGVVFRCIVRGALEPASYVMWYHGSQQIYSENSHGWKVQFERELENEAYSSVGTLTIAFARKHHSGNYSCFPSNSEPVQVTLHVINGESSASAVTSACSPSLGIYGNSFIIFIFTLFFLAT